MSTATREASAASKPVQASTADAEAPAGPRARPPSVTNGYINVAGLGGAFLALFAVFVLGLNPIIGALVCVAAYAAPIIFLELVVSRVHRRPSTGLRADAGSEIIDLQRVATKFLGFVGTLAIIFAIHTVIPFFSWNALRVSLSAAAIVMPIALTLSLPYIAYVDLRMKDPYDGYWHAGRVLLGRWREADRAILREHALAWAIKGFFLPIMFFYLADATGRLSVAGLPDLAEGVAVFARWMIDFTLFAELVIVCTGYFLTVRLFDSHIRTSNPFLAGWVVTLICYTPFSRVVFGDLLDYKDGLTWYDWFGAYSYVAIPWGLCIVFLTSLWVWATMIYGIRWSNLTLRGIVTGGPYRFTKHPDYIAKSLFWWFIYVPFLNMQSTVEAVLNCLTLLLVNVLYFARARYEEKHLSEDPSYVAYALWIEQHGVFRGLGRWIPALRYRPPASQAPARAP